MPLPLEGEAVIGIGEVPAHLPPAVAAVTEMKSVYAWVHRGLKTPDGRRVRLETLRLGKLFTSVEALHRFVAATTGAAPGAPERSPAQRLRESRAAGARVRAKMAKAGGN